MSNIDFPKPRPLEANAIEVNNEGEKNKKIARQRKQIPIIPKPPTIPSTTSQQMRMLWRRKNGLPVRDPSCETRKMFYRRRDNNDFDAIPRESCERCITYRQCSKDMNLNTPEDHDRECKDLTASCIETSELEYDDRCSSLDLDASPQGENLETIREKDSEWIECFDGEIEGKSIILSYSEACTDLFSINKYS